MGIPGINGTTLSNVHEATPTTTAPSAPTTSSATQATQAIGATTAGGGVDATGDNSQQANISSFAQLMERIKELDSTDPAKAKQMLGDIATRLRSEAQSRGKDATQLDRLADQFQKAADTGDLSALKTSGHSGHGHHHGGGKMQKTYGQGATEAQSLLALLNTPAASTVDATTPAKGTKAPG